MSWFRHHDEYTPGDPAPIRYAFLPEALAENAAGRLTDAQRAMFNQAGWQLRLFPTITGDLRNGRVRSIDGGLRKTRPLDLAHTNTPGPGKYALEVGGESFDIPSRVVWEAVPSVGFFRLYYLPRSRTAINLERLPDPVVDVTRPEDVIGAAWQAVGANLLPSILNRGRAREADLAAEADVMMRAAMAGGQGREDTAPVPGSGPVNPADLVGTWHNVFLTVDVRADGVLTVTTMNQRPQVARWYLDAQGSLHLQWDGASAADEMVTTVAVAGGRLSIDFAGRTMTLDRIG